MKLSGFFTTIGNDDRLLDKLVRLTFLAVIILAIAFAGYYYWDRYVHLGDQSPLELGVATLEEEVRQNPEDPEARLALAQYYLENGAYNKAAEQARQVLSAYPENDGALFVLGTSYIYAGQSEAAIEPLEQFAAIRSQSPMAGTDSTLEAALYHLGQSYVSLGNPAKAIPFLNEALTINRTDADAMYQLGLAYAQNGQHAEAIDQFHSAVRFVPDFVEVYARMISSYEAMGLPHQANYARGMVAYSNKEFAQAQDYLEPVTAVLPDFAPAFLGLGLVYEHLDDLSAAQSYVQRALDLEPESFLASHSLGRIQQALTGQGGG